MARLSPALCVALLFTCAAGSSIEVEKHRPVSKVITLLKDMVGQLQKEAEEDKEVFDLFGCWCETGLKGKTQAIADAEQKIGQLTETISELASSAARLNTEIGTLNKEVAANTEALDSATTMRQKELAEFTENEKSSLDTISTMKSALNTLSKHNSAAFLQLSDSAREEKLMETVAALGSQLRRHAGAIPKDKRAVVDAFLASPEDFLGSRRVAFLQQGADTAHNPAYAPQSGAIFGVLGAMKESFETNLAAAQKEEGTSETDYQGLKSAKTAEIAAGTSLADTKSEELGETEQQKAQADSDLKATERTLAADQEFLKNLKAKCAVVDEEYHQRTSTRQLEITAVSKALEYLSSDDAADLFSRTLNPTFLQLRARIPIGQEVAGSDQAAAEEAGAAEGGEMGLEQAAAAEKQDQAFEQVSESVEEMITRLVDEKEEEIKLKDFCVDSIAQNERDTDTKNRAKADYEAKIAELAQKIKTLATELAAHKVAIDESRVSLKRAGEDREKANTDFQRTVADQRATRKLLTGALKILEGFYKKEALVQTRSKAAAVRAPAGPPPPPDFKDYSKSAASGGVMGMIEQIIKDAAAMEEEALKSEKDAQIAYESFVAEANAEVVANQRAITKKTEIKAQMESDKAQNEVDLSTVNTELEELKTANLEFHKQCDYTLANFDDRQEARDKEIHSLKESVALLKGQMFHAAKSR